MGGKRGEGGGGGGGGRSFIDDVLAPKKKLASASCMWKSCQSCSK